MDEEKNNQESPENKLESLSKLRGEIDQLEQNINEAKRKELILSEERADMKILYKWIAPERPFNPKSKNWYITVFGFSIVVIILSVLTQTYLLILAVLAVLVVIYAQNTVVPPTFEMQITNKGVRVSDKLYLWRKIPQFWITQRGEDLFINFAVEGENIPRLTILSGDGDVNIITKELVRFIDYLSPDEVGGDFLFRLVEGRPKHINEFFEDKGQVTKVDDTLENKTPEEVQG